ncbi:histone-lysine N-methyltransferase EHMT2 isoform X7 [Paramormyrops kingsleyae]|uniref:histone-lysine N-methyltransferase EHMT2 isoform X7 n=1 Tax=Paramormyrops kingsleyae TaxID=1676925 RepID=UPI000CD64086|nr:histone-lysine N-methyltransferase EHMT2 isoform X7 [Paramormyrops kingsleyae]
MAPIKKKVEKEGGKKKEMITVEVKKEIIEKHERRMRVADIARFYNKSTSTICTILKKKEEIRGLDAAKGVTRVSKQRPHVLEDVEKLLLVWINEKQLAGDTVTETFICEKAKTLYTDLVSKLPGTSTENEGFKASRGWFDNFKKRSGIHSVVRHREAAISDAKAAEAFAVEFQKLMVSECYLPQQVFNCDEMGLFWKKMPKRTYITAEENAMPGHKPMKDRLTLLLCANASGDFKVKPLLVYHSENPRAFKKCRVQKNQLNVMWRSNRKAWVTRILFIEWINEVFGPAVKKYLLEKNLPLKVLLVMDNAPAHSPGLEDDLLEEFEFIKVKFLPPNTTPLLQPMDQQVISNFKKLYTKALFQQCFEVTEGTNLTLREFWKNHFHIVNCLKIIDKAWDGVTKRTLNSAWRKLWSDCVLGHGFEGFAHEQEPPVVNEIVSLGKTLGLEVNEEDIQELVEEHGQELTTDELMDLRREQQQEVMEEISSEEQPRQIDRFSKGLLKDKVPSEDKVAEPDPNVVTPTLQTNAGELYGTAVVPAETKPMGGLLSSQKEAEKEGVKEDEEGGKSGASATASGHAAKTLPPSSSSPSLSSSPGRAKMSLSGPASKSVATPFPSSSPGSLVTCVAPQPKIHRARKTMNRPPPTQGRCLESPFAPAKPVDPNSSAAPEADAAVKKRKVGPNSDSQALPTKRTENGAEAAVEVVDTPPAPAKAGPVTEQQADWLVPWDGDGIMYNYQDTEGGDSDSKSGDGTIEARLSEGDVESGNLSDRSSGSERQTGKWKEGGKSPWTRPGRRKRKERLREEETEMEMEEVVSIAASAPAAAPPAGISSEYTEVPLGSLDISAADSLTLSPHQAEDSEAGDTERLEELPLCSCRMEAPRVDGLSGRGGRLCMATESINGELVGCTNTIVKGETMRPSSRVSLMVLCENHRSHMVQHHCCPGCGYFCITGTFLECCPDLRITHRFHRGCVSVLGGGRDRGFGLGAMLFCPHCGEDASEAREVTIPPPSPASASSAAVVTASASTTTPSLPLPLPSSLPLGVTAGVFGSGRRPEAPSSARMRGRGEVRRGPEQQQSGAGGSVDVALPGDSGVDSVGPSLCLPNGKPICPSALSVGASRAALQKAILNQDTERRKKLRFHPRQLYPATKQGEVQRVLLMLMEGIDPAYQSDSQNRRCALHAAAQRGFLEICYLLIQAGAKVDTPDKSLRTPLLEAIINNHVEVVRYLIQSGACVYHTEDDGSTGLHHAAKLGNLDIVNLLLGTGQVDINAQVGARGRGSRLGSWQGDPGQQDSGGWTPIIWAAEHRHIAVIRALLNRGADVTLNDKEMNVCLHWASFAGSVEIAELLLNAGCPLSSVNVHGDTPLHIASREGYLDCVTLFLSRGAEIDIKNREGDTPLSLARCDSPVWVSLQINRKLRKGIANRILRTEKIICSDVAQGYENVPIPCVNGVDEEGCPSDYKYISENCETSAMNIDRNITHLQHCSCTDDCSSSNCLCGQLSIRCWYDKDRRLLQEFNKIEPPLIFECNLACSCYRTCKNRVVQAGIKVRLQLYRTEKMGWGVRALQDIPQGSFICEYVGELISDAEADVREDDSYLFDLDNKDGEVYCIDARYYGNISRFINHLCDPNIIPVRVFMLHQDLRFPRIAFFSSRDILTGQELGFDYGDRFWDIKSKYFTCQCGSEKCKHSAEAIALEQSRLARLEACPEVGPDPGLALLSSS